jgi:ppGpp synthetase/RelA/SpoT-type nucleotidyltranferase
MDDDNTDNKVANVTDTPPQETPASASIIPTPFDFTEHERAAISAYLAEQPFYIDLAGVIARVIDECLRKRCIKVQSIQHRAKTPNSFGRKAATPSEADPNTPKYPEPLKQITDLAGVRIITYLPAMVDEIDKLLHEEFEVIERSDKGQQLIEEEGFGYDSVHYLIRVKAPRPQLAEYSRFADRVTEVQVRTILQDAWAEIEHDIQYKSSTAIPVEIRRRFMALAGLLELADREFQAIQDQDRELTHSAQSKVSSGDLGGVEITPNALKLFLDKKLGSDYRIADMSYDWTARMLKRLGFRDLKQVETAIRPYNDDQLSTIAAGTRQGQISRFELMLLAALGERFIDQHPLSPHVWFTDRQKHMLAKFKEKNILTATFDPSQNKD